MDPFICVGMVDFDDGIIKTDPPERVKQSKILKYQGQKTFFLDTNFDKTSSYIYAIVSLDAHGMSSSYGIQTYVEFNASTNSIKTRQISIGGAPKQYPNFFVDPEMDPNINVPNITQDAIFSSSASKVKIYRDLDCRDIEKRVDPRRDRPKSREQLYLLDGFDGLNVHYKFQFINVDLAKSLDFELRFELED